MLSIKVLISVLAAFAAAETSANPCSMSTTLTAASAVSLLNACPTLQGEITIKGEDITEVDLSKVITIEALLNVSESKTLNNINFGSLEKVPGSLLIAALTSLNAMLFPLLKSAKELIFRSLPQLASLNLNLPLANITSLVVSDTGLSTFDNFLPLTSIERFDFNNNKAVVTINAAGLKETKELHFSFNNPKVVIDLSDLKRIERLTIQDASSFDISDLEFVEKTLMLGYNSVTRMNLDSLKSVGESARIYANNKLITLDMNDFVEALGELQVFNNTILNDVDLSELKKVQGAVNFTGVLGNLNMKKLELVKGDFYIEGTAKNFTCKQFDKLQSEGKIEGNNYKCSSPSSTSLASKSGSSTATGSSRSSSDSSSGSSGSSSKSSDSSQNPTSSRGKSGAAYLRPDMLISVVMGAAIAVIA